MVRMRMVDLRVRVIIHIVLSDVDLVAESIFARN